VEKEREREREREKEKKMRKTARGSTDSGQGRIGGINGSDIPLVARWDSLSHPRARARGTRYQWATMEARKKERSMWLAERKGERSRKRSQRWSGGGGGGRPMWVECIDLRIRCASLRIPRWRVYATGHNGICRLPRSLSRSIWRTTIQRACILEGFSPSCERTLAYIRISNIHCICTRATVVADVEASYMYTWVARRTITDASPRRAVKASQSSFHRCSLHGRVGNIRGDSKGNQIQGKANERPGHARHIHNIGAYVHTLSQINIHTMALAMNIPRTFARTTASARFFRLVRLSSTCHSSRRINRFLTLSRFLTWRPWWTNVFPCAVWKCSYVLHLQRISGINHIRSFISFELRNVWHKALVVFWLQLLASKVIH